jgi:uncharacterized protein YndB with AHSA1/START domain
VAAPTEKDADTMPTQKIFKQRVRARMTKTGESYTAARRQLLKKATELEAAQPVRPENQPQPSDAAQSVEPSDGTTPGFPTDALLVADESMVRATGKGHAEWFALLDAWGATDHNHTEIARWLTENHGTPGWWTQNLTVAYERARGMRARHQQADGYSISVTRTIAVDPARAMAAFTNPRERRRWVADAAMHQRPTRAALTARFDWSDSASRVVVTVVPKGDKSTVAVTHERVPDPDTAERLKTMWRGWLGDLKDLLEREQ